MRCLMSESGTENSENQSHWGSGLSRQSAAQCSWPGATGAHWGSLGAEPYMECDASVDQGITL